MFIHSNFSIAVDCAINTAGCLDSDPYVQSYWYTNKLIFAYLCDEKSRDSK